MTDGPVHLPLGNAAILETQLLMLGSHNVLNPADGALSPCLRGTRSRSVLYASPAKGVKTLKGLTFYSPGEAIIAYNEAGRSACAGEMYGQSDVDENGNKVRVLKETIGRILFNQVVRRGQLYQ